MRKAQAFPCPYGDTYTGETAALLRAHITKKHTSAVMKDVGAIAFKSADLWGDPTGMSFVVKPKRASSKLEGKHSGHVWVEVKE